MIALLDEHSGEYQTQKRKSWVSGSLGIILTFLIQLVAVIWSIATSKAALDTTVIAVDKLDRRQSQLEERQLKLDLKNAEQAGYNAALKDMVFKLQEDRRR